jgi:uncharacterized membrane protein
MLGTSTYLIVFRIIHIVVGVVWVGGVAQQVLFIQPSGSTLGPAAGPFLQEMLVRRQLPKFIVATGGITIIAGLFLYWHDWQVYGSLGDWVSSRYGLVLTIGAVFAVLAFLIGSLVVRPITGRIMTLATGLAAAPPPPPPEQAAELQRLQLRARRLTITVLILLMVAVIAMATAQYW